MVLTNPIFFFEISSHKLNKTEPIIELVGEAVGAAITKRVHDEIDHLKDEVAKRLKQDEPVQSTTVESKFRTPAKTNAKQVSQFISPKTYVPRLETTRRFTSFYRTNLTRSYRKKRRAQMPYSNF